MLTGTDTESEMSPAVPDALTVAEVFLTPPAKE